MGFFCPWQSIVFPGHQLSWGLCAGLIIPTGPARQSPSNCFPAQRAPWDFHTLSKRIHKKPWAAPRERRVYPQDEVWLFGVTLRTELCGGKSTHPRHRAMPTHHVPHVGPNGVVEIKGLGVTPCLSLHPAFYFLLLKPFHLQGKCSCDLLEKPNPGFMQPSP